LDQAAAVSPDPPKQVEASSQDSAKDSPKEPETAPDAEKDSSQNKPTTSAKPSGDDSPDPTREADTVPDAECGTKTESSAKPDKLLKPPSAEDIKFQKLVKACKDLTENKVAAHLAGLTQASVFSDKSLWDVPKGQEHLMAKKTLPLCKDIRNIRHNWPLIKKCRGRSLGNASAEVKLLMSCVLIPFVFDQLMESVSE
jgi:hypothetical protein